MSPTESPWNEEPLGPEGLPPKMWERGRGWSGAPSQGGQAPFGMQRQLRGPPIQASYRQAWVLGQVPAVPQLPPQND